MAETITVVGNIGYEPMRKATPKGEVLEFSLAHNTGVPAEGGGWKDGETVWYRVSAWDRLGSNAASSLRKGQRVIVHGVLRPNTWTGRDGVERTSLDLRAQAIGHDLAVGTSSFTRAPAAPVASQEQPRPAQTPTASSHAAAARPEQQAGDWGAPATEAAQAPVPAGPGWNTIYAADEEAPF